MSNIITVPVNGQIQIENKDSELTRKYRAILSAKASNKLDIKTLEKEQVLAKANFINSMTEIKTDVFAPTLLNDFEKTKYDIIDLDTKIQTLKVELEILGKEVAECNSEEDFRLIELKKTMYNSDIISLKEEREKKQKYILDVFDQFAFKDTFKDKTVRKEEPLGGFAGIMSLMATAAGASAGIAVNASNKTTQIINKPKKKRSKINPDIEKLFEM